MDQLTQLVSMRFNRVKEILETTPAAEYLRSLKQEQRGRCQKENWILSMMRNNKNNSIGLKKANFEYSFKIMKIIDPNFECQIIDSSEQAQKKLQENFLNEFVTLYRMFFDRFQQKFNFKIKIRNFLRPTNHNIINDLIKYLVDFSRDYYQQIFFWHLRGGLSLLNNQLPKQSQDKDTKNTKIKPKVLSQQIKNIQVQEQSQSRVFNQQDCQQGNTQKEDQLDEKIQGIETLQQKLTKTIDIQRNRQKNQDKKSKPPRRSNKNKLHQRSITVVQESKGLNSLFKKQQQNTNMENNDNLLILKKIDYLKNYQILDIKDLPSLVSAYKDKGNPELLKLKLNELYRDMKFRNAFAKASSNIYFNRYQKDLNPLNPNIQIPASNSANPILIKTLCFEDKSGLKMTFPFKISLTIQKNGFSCINVCLVESRNINRRDSLNNGYLSPIKEKLDGSDIRQYKSQLNNGVPINFKNQFSLSSLRVLRVSQNFLPPLIQSKMQMLKSKVNNNQSKQYKIYYDDQVRQKTRLSMGHIGQGQGYLAHNPKENSMTNIRSASPQKIYNQHPLSSSEQRKQQTWQKKRYYDTQVPLKQVKPKISKKLKSNALGTDKGTISLRKNFNSQDRAKQARRGVNDPEQKIMQWLGKIRLMKQIEKKKIMGFG